MINRKMSYKAGLRANLGESDIRENMPAGEFERQKAKYHEKKESKNAEKKEHMAKSFASFKGNKKGLMEYLGSASSIEHKEDLEKRHAIRAKTGK